MTKFCTSCETIKAESKFHRNGSRLRSECKECISKKRSLHYKENKTRILESRRDYWIKNKLCISSRRKDYTRKYIQDNKERLNKYHKDWVFVKRREDLNFKLRDVLRCRLRIAINNNQKTGSAVRDLGCPVEELKAYLESRFQSGMSWENYGKWHIDHIIPLCSFDLSERKQLKKACHYSNLQPLWAENNLSKGGKII